MDAGMMDGRSNTKGQTSLAIGYEFLLMFVRDMFDAEWVLRESHTLSVFFKCRCVLEHSPGHPQHNFIVQNVSNGE